MSCFDVVKYSGRYLKLLTISNYLFSMDVGLVRVFNQSRFQRLILEFEFCSVQDVNLEEIISFGCTYSSRHFLLWYLLLTDLIPKTKSRPHTRLHEWQSEWMDEWCVCVLVYVCVCACVRAYVRACTSLCVLLLNHALFLIFNHIVI